jgi:hypothetical protein
LDAFLMDLSKYYSNCYQGSIFIF